MDKEHAESYEHSGSAKMKLRIPQKFKSGPQQFANSQ